MGQKFQDITLGPDVMKPVGGLFNPVLFNPGLFNSDYSTNTIQLGLLNSSVKTQLHFTQLFYGLNEMGLNSPSCISRD